MINEILAPCGNPNSLFAALNAGADAVYVGMKEFSARQNAENFSDEELKNAVLECHKRGVRLYVTLNTLVYDSELDELAKCIKTAAELGVDGLIIQDLGAASLARKICPKLPIHSSTQMTLNSVSGVKAAKKLGFSRVVIGRELSEKEIEYISDNADIELEIFVHGALCVCVSGQCYMSSLFGGRSGNRGLCAQPCRLDFSYKGRSNVISLKDQSLIEHLREPALSGMASFKIEGRMKRPEYVACAVDACRKSLAGESYDFERLSKIFSRDGLTEGYYDGSMADMNGIRDKNDVMNTIAALRGIKALYKDEFPRFPVNINVEIKKDCRVSVSGSINKSGSEVLFVTQTEIIPEEAKGAPLDAESVCARLSKLGGTMFYPNEITAEVEEGLYVSAADLNSIRRDVCETLSKAILENSTRKYKTNEYVLPRKSQPREEDTINYRAEVATSEQLRQATELDFDLIYAPMNLLDETVPNKRKIAVIPPLVLSDCEEDCEQRLKELRDMGFNKGLAHTLAHAELLKKCEFNVLGGYRMNILNSLSAKVCSDFGFWDVTLSFEGTATALAEISSTRPVGIVAYGRLPLMLTRRCPIADGKPCGRKNALCRDEGRENGCGECIKDRHGNDIPVLCGGNCVELLNPDTLVLSDKPEILRKFDFAVLKFTTETNVGDVMRMYKSGAKPEGKFTRGLYFRGAE